VVDYVRIIGPFANGTGATAAVNDLLAGVAGKQRIFYLRWDTIQNEEDPKDALPQALSARGVQDANVQFNPRMHLQSWLIGQ
jgi:hypothetical protein